MTTGPRPLGDFCWINMLTPQPAQARAFFAELLGWTYVELPGVGHTVHVGGQGIGGLFDLAGPRTPPGTPPHIGVMIKVASADAAGRQVAALGGKAQPAFDIGDQLRMAVCSDPNGAEFDVWESRRQQGTVVDSRLHGAPSWFETLTDDVDRAAAFYAGLFGWTPLPMRMPGHVYTVFKRGEAFVAGAMRITPEMGALRPHWATYFTVDDADAAARDAARLGARVCVPPTDIPNVGRFCGITSPQGVTFYVLAYR